MHALVLPRLIFLVATCCHWLAAGDTTEAAAEAAAEAALLDCNLAAAIEMTTHNNSVKSLHYVNQAWNSFVFGTKFI